MRKSLPLGLICAGPAKNLAFARLPGIVEEIGPVKAVSFRLASRTTNTLRYGYPVRHYAELADCGVVLLCLPDRAVPKVLDELLHSSIPWSGKGLVLVSAPLDSADLRALSQRGASVASVYPLEDLAGPRYLAEGDRVVLRELRNLLPAESRLLELSAGAKHLCLAGIALATTSLTPIIESAVDCLSSAGLQSREAALLVERLMQGTVRGYAKAGRKSWTGALADKDWTAVHKQLEALLAHDPELGRWFELGARHAVRRMHKGVEWPFQARHKTAT